jgi:hypothetical protein
MGIAVLVKGTGAKHRDPIFQLTIFLVLPQLKNHHIRANLRINENSNLKGIIVSVVTCSIIAVRTKSGCTERNFILLYEIIFWWVM